MLRVYQLDYPGCGAPPPSLQSTAECVKHYYLCKKNEHFKQLVRKANLKRRKNFAKSHVSVLTVQYASVVSRPPAQRVTCCILQAIKTVVSCTDPTPPKVRVVMLHRMLGLHSHLIAF